jgi:hypothetical protein
MIILTIRVEITIRWLLGHHPKYKQINHKNLGMHSNPLNMDKEPTYRLQNYLEIHSQQANAIHNLRIKRKEVFH